ncbi:MAG: 16S rRNA (cytidine(1402)-2'-O)-methyltransferase [Thiomargarita sp.]|nr:16S rRNA (cytidine(1402)-2'-O)-methyltransferase [Thiomargarita sp.]
MNQTGTLYVVATPIGNLQDFSPRAQSILCQVDLIAAEDTRHSHYLLNNFGIKTPLQALHEHNEKQQCHSLLKILHQGKQIALISDAGTPLISDPGYFLVKTAHAENITVIPIPGASALISALSVSGFSSNRFVFEGFLPNKSIARQKHLSNLLKESRTLVFYEAPHRLINCLNDMKSIFGESREIVLAKELTKVFEKVYRGSFSNIIDWLNEKPERQKGEFVILVEGALKESSDKIDVETERVFKILSQELSLKQAAKLTSRITGANKNSLYKFGLEQI